MDITNFKSKSIPIKTSSSNVKQPSSSSPPQSASPGASSLASSFLYSELLNTTNPTVARSNSLRASFSSGEQDTVGICRTARSSKSASDVPGSGDSTAAHISALQFQSPQKKNDQISKTDPLAIQFVKTTNSNQPYCHISSDILDDLASRFIINVPDDERKNLIRICFQIELAHWFYLDFFCANDEKKCGMKQFAMSLFNHIPFLREHLVAIDKILEKWKQYKLTVPTYGAILMSEDLNYVLLVQSYWAKSSWGFPKGKVNENEDPIHCAAREVYEETGYDITHLIVESDYIETVINDQYTRLYLVRNVPLKTLFMPRTRQEIKCCEWFLIDSLPTSKNDTHTKQNLGINANSFFMIMPFIKRLKKWISEKRLANDTNQLYALGNKSKLNGNTSNSNGQNNGSQARGKKLFPAPIQQSAPTYQNNSILQSRSSSANKRPRHKSMGDLDGLVKVKTNQNQNIRPVNSAKPNSSNVLKASTMTGITVFEQYDTEQREKTINFNTRRQKLTSQCDPTFTDVSPLNTLQFGQKGYKTTRNTAPSEFSSCSYNNTKPIDSILEKAVDLKSQKNNLYFNNNSSGSSSTSSITNTIAETSLKNNSQNLLRKSISFYQSVSNVGAQSLGFPLDSYTANSYTTAKNSQTQNLSTTNLKSVNLPRKTKIDLKRSQHFNSWRTFSFMENCITNVFC